MPEHFRVATSFFQRVEVAAEFFEFAEDCYGVHNISPFKIFRMPKHTVKQIPG